MTYLTFLNFFNISRLCDLSASVFKLSQISLNFSNILKKNLRISGPMQFKPVLFKGQMYSV